MKIRILIISLMLLLAGTMISASEEDEVVLKQENISELVEVRDMLINDTEVEAINKIITYLEDNEEITMDEIEDLLSTYSGLRINLVGQVDKLPNRLRAVIPIALWLPKDNLNLLSGRVNDIKAPPKIEVSWTFFIGYANMYDIKPCISMVGFAFGLSIDTTTSGVKTRNNILREYINRLMDIFDRLFEFLKKLIPIEYPT